MGSRKTAGRRYPPGACVLQNVRQNETREIMRFFAVSGIFKGNLADRRYEISQSGVDSVAAMIYFHAALFR